MRDIIIIGNGGAALETYTTVQDMLTLFLFRNHHRFKGFLRHGDYEGNLGELSSLELGADCDYEPTNNDVFVVAIGNNRLRMEVHAELKRKGLSFLNVVSPWVYVASSVRMGEGNIINIGCHISNNVSIGDANYLNGEVRLGHHTVLGDGNFIASRAMTMGATHIGNGNHIGPGVIIMEHAKIGSHNKIAPAAVVFKGCRDACLMAGNPALKLNDLED